MQRNTQRLPSLHFSEGLHATVTSTACPNATGQPASVAPTDAPQTRGRQSAPVTSTEAARKQIHLSVKLYTFVTLDS